MVETYRTESVRLTFLSSNTKSTFCLSITVWYRRYSTKSLCIPTFCWPLIFALLAPILRPIHCCILWYECHSQTFSCNLLNLFHFYRFISWNPSLQFSFSFSLILHSILFKRLLWQFCKTHFFEGAKFLSQ